MRRVSEAKIFRDLAGTVWEPSVVEDASSPLALCQPGPQSPLGLGFGWIVDRFRFGCARSGQIPSGSLKPRIDRMMFDLNPALAGFIPNRRSLPILVRGL